MAFHYNGGEFMQKIIVALLPL